MPRHFDGDVLKDALMEDDNKFSPLDQRRKALDEIRKVQLKQREPYDRSRGEARNYQPGDLVMVRGEPTNITGESRKLMPK